MKAIGLVAVLVDVSVGLGFFAAGLLVGAAGFTAGIVVAVGQGWRALETLTAFAFFGTLAFSVLVTAASLWVGAVAGFSAPMVAGATLDARASRAAGQRFAPSARVVGEGYELCCLLCGTNGLGAVGFLSALTFWAGCSWWMAVGCAMGGNPSNAQCAFALGGGPVLAVLFWLWLNSWATLGAVGAWFNLMAPIPDENAPPAQR